MQTRKRQGVDREGVDAAGYLERVRVQVHRMGLMRTPHVELHNATGAQAIDGDRRRCRVIAPAVDGRPLEMNLQGRGVTGRGVVSAPRNPSPRNPSPCPPHRVPLTDQRSL